ncbi:hypothetical protein [Streptomyces antimicrobicus]|uniref:ABC transporter permease n=1 Tax=Streptomyces antimicrobicus TaxID=2883108 RepID=A0ABS8B094_9ACTN|nr:hypothetical protein [Streptomyces antimicrobicus]MCB5178027.1 hypothetical protein [Streptomyces antimicrobicus]
MTLLDTTPATGVSRGMRLTAKAASLTVLPSCLWRLLIAVGIPVGWGPGSELHHTHYPGWGSLYLLALSVFQECLGLLALGLVQRWGEIVPHWVPWLGGRRIPPPVALVPAALGAVALIGITALGALNWNDVMAADPDSPSEGFGYWLFTLSYAPLLLWGPLLAIVTADCARRRLIHG